jgi:hypothetical protein
MPEIVNADLARNYGGAFETNNLATTGLRHEDTDNSETVDLGDPRLVRVLRIRLLSDPGFPVYDVSYVLGRLDDGRQVHVDLGAHQLGKRTYLSELYTLARDAGVHLNRLCGGHVRDVLSRMA